MSDDACRNTLSEALPPAGWPVRMANVPTQAVRRNGYLRAFLTALLVFTSYSIGATIGVTFGFPAAKISVFWPPNVVLIAALLLTPRRVWWVIFAAGLPAEYLAASFPGAPFYIAGLNYAANAGQALLTAILLKKFCGGLPHFDSFRSTAKLIAIAAIIAPAIGSIFVGIPFVLTGWITDLWLFWEARFLTDLLSALILIPPVLAILTADLARLRQTPLNRYLEFGLLLLSLMFIVALVLGKKLPQLESVPAWLYLPLPIFTWAAFRFGVVGVAVSLLLTAIVALGDASAGRGVFVAEPADNVLGLQIFLSVIGVPLMLLAALWAERRTTVEALQKSNLQIRHLADQLIAAQEEERAQIARELHDEIGQALTTVKISLDTMRLTSKSASPSPLLDDGIARVDHALDQVRNLALLMRPAMLDDLGLESALRWLANSQAERAGYNMTFTCDELQPRPPHEIETICYRIAQEALTNIARHARACRVTVDLRRVASNLHMTIRDDGVGFDVAAMRSRAAHGGSMGLLCMEERARLGGGVLRIESAPGQGTKLLLNLPY